MEEEELERIEAIDAQQLMDAIYRLAYAIEAMTEEMKTQQPDLDK